MTSEDWQEPGSCPCLEMDRRTLLLSALGAGVGLAAAPALAQQQQPGAATPARKRPQPGDVFVRATGDDKSTPLMVDDVPMGGPPVQAWPMDLNANVIRNGTRLNKLLLVRLDPNELDSATRQNAAEGTIVYSVICTHTGCDVTGWREQEKILQCPCHFSRFDPKRNAQVVAGPAPRHLPALGVRAEQGRLVVAKPFDSRVGFTSSACWEARGAPNSLA